MVIILQAIDEWKKNLEALQNIPIDIGISFFKSK
jgi:hypothetical protein